MQRKRVVTPIPSVFSLLWGNETFSDGLELWHINNFLPFLGAHFVATSTIFTFHPIRLGPWSYTSKLHEEHHPPAGTVLVKAQPKTVCRSENLNQCCLTSFLPWIFFVLASHVQLPSIYLRGKIFLVQPFPKTKKTNPRFGRITVVSVWNFA